MKRLFRQKNPEKFPPEAYISVHGDDDLEYPLKFTDPWLKGFLDCHKFSHRKLSTKMNKPAVTESMLSAIEQYHLKLRMKQLETINDPVYGCTSPYYVFSHDQVPLELAASTETTIDTEGVSD